MSPCTCPSSSCRSVSSAFQCPLAFNRPGSVLLRSICKKRLTNALFFHCRYDEQEIGPGFYDLPSVETYKTKDPGAAGFGFKMEPGPTEMFLRKERQKVVVAQKLCE